MCFPDDLPIVQNAELILEFPVARFTSISGNDNNERQISHSFISYARCDLMSSMGHAS